MGFFTKKTVIITAFAKEGANLGITGSNVQKLSDAKEELERL